MTGQAEDRLYTKAELAAWLGVTESWVRDAITARRIPITWVGRHARFSPENRAAIVAAGREPAPHMATQAVKAAPVVPMPRRAKSGAVATFQPRPSRRSA